MLYFVVVMVVFAGPTRRMSKVGDTATCPAPSCSLCVVLQGSAAKACQPDVSAETANSGKDKTRITWQKKQSGSKRTEMKEVE